MTEQEKLNTERNELNTLINKGVSFEVERTIRVVAGRKYLLFKKYTTKTEKLKFTIQEPTLSTLDRISAEQIELHIDENVMSSDSGITEAKKMTNLHAKRMARIVALAVLGQDYAMTIQEGARIRYKFDDEKLDQLTEMFFANIKPSKLMQLTILVNTMSNLGDFMNSIRLMSAARTTMPIRIEENNAD